MQDLEKIRAREADPAVLEHAQLVSEKINGRLDQQRVKVYGTMARHMPTPEGKVGMLRGMASELQTAVRDLVPCSRGCSDCCHMPTLMSEAEAAVIAGETGAALATPAAYFDGLTLGDDSPYKGVPCPFLRNHQCGIYAHRPFACRLHVHIDRDNTLCKVFRDEKIRVPRLDTLAFDVHYMKAFGNPLTVRVADIRDFFPQGLAK